MTVQIVQGVQSQPEADQPLAELLRAPFNLLLTPPPPRRSYYNVILRSGATKNLLFGFVVSEHERRFDRSTEKSRSFARAQDDTGAIFGLRQSLSRGGEKQPRADIQR